MEPDPDIAGNYKAEDFPMPKSSELDKRGWRHPETASALFPMAHHNKLREAEM